MAKLDRIAVAEQLVETGAKLIARQKALVETLRESGRSTLAAESTLARFERAQRDWLADAERLRDEQGEDFRSYPRHAPTLR